MSDNSSIRLKYKIRFLAVLVFFVLITLLYIFHLFSLQIVKGYEYRKRAQEVSSRVMTIPSQRGEIFDSNYDIPLASNIDSFAISLIPAELPLNINKLNILIKKLSDTLDLDIKEIDKKIPENYSQHYQEVEIKKGVDYRKIVELAENIEEYPGLRWKSKPIRRYNDKSSLSHIIGYVGDITQAEFQTLYNKGYEIDSVLGKSGIEKEYDSILRGKRGRSFKTVDVKGRKISAIENKDIPPVPGKNIILSIDSKIQLLCEKALGDRIGSAIVLRPSNGEIVAMVSYPWYNPNKFYSDESSSYYKELSLDPTFPFLNRAIQSNYAPASTFKTIMTAAVIEEELFPVNKKVYCSGKLRYGDRFFNCHKKTGHGYLDLISGLAESCDVYFWTVGTEYVGIERIAEYSRRFGLGTLTGIDIPGEVSGLVPGPKWKENVFHSKWLGGDTMNISIGQGYLTSTPLQMANAVAMIVNEGKIYKPHFMKEVRDPISGAIIEEYVPSVIKTTTIRSESFKKLKEAMRYVITDGTAKWVINTKAVDIAGKTGTGEVGFDDRWHSWFIAYGPYETENPEDQLIVVTMVEAVNEWDWWAPKAANLIFQGIFADQTYEETVKTLRPWYIKR